MSSPESKFKPHVPLKTQLNMAHDLLVSIKMAQNYPTNTYVPKVTIRIFRKYFLRGSLVHCCLNAYRCDPESLHCQSVSH
uniref:Uncharacterized protein n=1 Tax=Anguilla anguilla TaxID=7936 RepID=A0A0E9WNW8_ANGAN